MADRLDEWLVRWQGSYQSICLFGLVDGYMADRLAGFYMSVCLSGWVDGCMAGRLAGCMAGWLGCRSGYSPTEPHTF